MGIFTKLFQKFRQNKNLQRQIKELEYCSLEEIEYLNKLSFQELEEPLNGVDFPFEKLRYKSNPEYWDWLVRGLEKAGMGWISVDCYAEFMLNEYTNNYRFIRRFR